MDIILHVGYPKAASTYLQERVFPAAKGVFYLNEEDKVRDRWIRHNINHLDDREFQRSESNIKDNVDRSVSELKASRAIFSSEAFTTRLPKKVEERVSLRKRALRLKRAFGSSAKNVSILIVVRNQVDIIKSRFRYHYGIFRKEMGLNSLNEFVNYEINNFNGGYMETLLYDKVSELYEDIFGRDNVNVYSMEYVTEHETKIIRELTGDHKIYIEKNGISDKGIPKKSQKNEGEYIKPNYIYEIAKQVYSPISNYINPRSSIFGRAIIRKLQRLPDLLPFSSAKTIFLSEENKKKIKNVYKHSNEIMYKKYNVDIQ